MYRPLYENEISLMESQGCRCSDWTAVTVAENFSAANIRNTTFDGDIQIGNDCRIENVGIIRTTDGATYGNGITISVLNEAGDGNLVLFNNLTSQIAALMVRYNADSQVFANMRSMILREVNATKPACTTIGDGVTISFTRELTNVIIGNQCEIIGASRLVDCSLNSTAEASIFIGDNVICENVIIQAGSSLTDGAKLYDSFVGEACHVGRGFTSEASAFFANSHMDNGESCAALCGPFSVSHHKASLLIGGEYSFYNAGSSTNFSNHAYKMGPMHYGTLQRGSKTASGAHTLWPAQVGTFSMLMGKIQTHPDTRRLPFSYLIASGDTTFLVPGRNLTTVGTYRDIDKWPKRDRRPHSGRQSLVQYDWLSPLTIGACIEGKKVLEQLRREQGENIASYSYKGTTIRNQSLQKGIKYYDLAIRLYLQSMLENDEIALPSSTKGTGKWVDLLGMLAPASEVESLIDDIRRGEISDINDVTSILRDIHEAYDEQKWAWTYRMILDYMHLDTITEEDKKDILQQCGSARQEWLAAIRYDAEREYELGDVDQDALNDFLKKIQ